MHRVFLFALFIAASNVSAGLISRGPYLENFTDKSAVIRFRVQPSTVAWLTYGAFPDCERFSTFSGFTSDHKVQLNGLLADTTHCYRIYLPVDGSTQAYKAFEGRLKTFKDEKNPALSFLVFGGPMPQGEELKKLVMSMSAFEEAEFAVYTGNITDTGLDIDADARYFSIYAPLLKIIPVYYTLGKMDYGANFNNRDGSGFIKTNFYPYHSVPLNGLPPHYYYFDDGDSRFIVLDGNSFEGAVFAPSLKKDSKQYMWLENVLKNTSKKWKFVFIHQPLYSTGESGGFNEAKEILAPLFEKYEVDIVFQGGDRDYERFKPLKEDQESDDGVIYVNAGGWPQEPSARDAEEEGPSDVFLQKPNFALLNIDGGRLEMKVYGPEGEILDSLAVEKK